ncbi:hypothetical protein AAG565_14205 [Fontimonas sp. SYSU GA230001]|uniref:hypothetical protein n=1 Tax=Fontimonas sp. SYSU GA230001 TaxID=3142450 RepID=UPI0032B336C7
MRLDELFIAAGLASDEQVAAARTRQLESGRPLGESLVAAGAISQLALDRFMERIPAEPEQLADSHIDGSVLLDLTIKLIYAERLETAAQIAAAIKLPPHLVAELLGMAVNRGLLQCLGERDLTMRYALTGSCPTSWCRF